MLRTTLSIPAVVDESVRLPEVLVARGENVALDLGGLKLMNSAGIRLWIRWIQPLTSTTNLSLINCPMIFLNLSSIVMDVVPDGVHIESFVVNYLHVQDDRELRLHVELSPSGQFEVPEMIVAEDGQQYEFDGLVGKTFARFKGKVNFLPNLRAADFSKFGLSLA